MMFVKDLDPTLAALPEHLRRGEDFAGFLLNKYSRESRQKVKSHPLADLAGAWKDESVEDLLPERGAGRDIDF